MPTYKFTAPNGNTVNVTGDTPPSESELDEIFKAAGTQALSPEFSRRGGMANPAMQSAADAPAEPDVVTLGELKENPKAAMQRIGAILGKDITDPKMLMTLAASYFGPKVFSAAAPYVGRAVMRMAPAAVTGAATVAGGVAGGAVGGVGGAIGGAVAGRSLGQSLAGRMARPAPEVEVAAPPHLDLSQRVPAGALTQQQIGERLSAARQQGMTAPQVEPVKNPATPVRVPLPERPTTPPGPPEPSVAAEPFNAPRVKPPTPKELNEQAIQRHRAIVTAARENGVELKPGDLDALKTVVQSGVAPEEAVSALKASRTVTLKSADVEEAMTQSSQDPAAELARRFNLPSDAERTFPPNKSGLPTKTPTARKAMGKVADLADMPAEKTKTHPVVGDEGLLIPRAKVTATRRARYDEANAELDRIAARIDRSTESYGTISGSRGRDSTVDELLGDRRYREALEYRDRMRTEWEQAVREETRATKPTTARKARGKIADLAEMPVTKAEPVPEPTLPVTSKASSSGKFDAGEKVRFNGRSVNGEVEGSMDVKIVDPHSNKANVTRMEKAGKNTRMYEGASVHLPTALVENSRGKQFEVPWHTLQQMK